MFALLARIRPDELGVDSSPIGRSGITFGKSIFTNWNPFLNAVLKELKFSPHKWTTFGALSWVCRRNEFKILKNYGWENLTNSCNFGAQINDCLFSRFLKKLGLRVCVCRGGGTFCLASRPKQKFSYKLLYVICLVLVVCALFRWSHTHQNTVCGLFWRQ